MTVGREEVIEGIALLLLIHVEVETIVPSRVVAQGLSGDLLQLLERSQILKLLLSL